MARILWRRCRWCGSDLDAGRSVCPCLRDEPSITEPARAAIVLAHPVRVDRVGYRAILFYANGATEISLRLGYAAAVAFAEQRGAVIAFDESAKPLSESNTPTRKTP